MRNKLLQQLPGHYLITLVKNFLGDKDFDGKTLDVRNIHYSK